MTKTKKTNPTIAQPIFDPGFNIPDQSGKRRKSAMDLTPDEIVMRDAWTKFWIGNAMSTRTIVDDMPAIQDAVTSLYQAADLAPPARDQIVYAPGPMSGMFACAAASWAIAQGEPKAGAKVPVYRKTGDVGYDATVECAIAAAGRHAANFQPQMTQPDGTIKLRTSTERNPVPGKPTLDGEWFTDGNTGVACYHLAGEAGLAMASGAISMRDGGNQWSGSACFVSFGRYCLMLDIDYTKWDAYERLTVLSGPRYVHENFCIVCDKPTVLTVDNANPPRPHNDDGPYCAWRDGVELFMVHNVSIPAWVFKDKGLLSMARIEAERNAEVKRVMLSKFGVDKYLSGPGVTVRDEVALDAKGVPAGMRGAKLVARELEGDRDPVVALLLLDATPEDDGTRERYFIEVNPDTQTVLEGLAAGYRVTPEQYLTLGDET